MSVVRTKMPANQRGFASIVIALVLVVVMALLTVGFAQLTSREQQDALDKQLATQAYYAAETGINDVYQYIENGLHDETPAITSGSNGNCYSGAPLTTTEETINQPADVSYTCAIVDLTPPNIQYTNLNSNVSKTAEFSTASNLTSIEVQWSSSSGDKAPAATTGSFSPNSGQPTGDWSYPAVLQFSITPLGAGPYNNTSLIEDTYTVFLYPSHGAGGTIAYGVSADGAGEGTILGGNCDNDGNCNATITGLGAPGSPYMVHLLDLYDESNVTITGYVGATPEPLQGVQAEIDVTGKAQDVLKRLQVRVPLGNPASLPDYALEAENICKRMESLPGQTTFYDVDGSGSLEPVSDNSSPCYLQ